MMMNRTFGVEIECIGISQTAAHAAITAAGFACEIEGYNHNTRTHWKIVTDGSVRDNRGNPGIEVVSPVLRGVDGLNQLRTVAAALSAAGATANKTCGLHVHVGAADLTINEIKMIVKRYESFENVIDSYMPVSRRANNNTYLKSMADWTRAYGTQLAACGTVSDILSRSWDRYYKVNLAAYVRQNTIEFRQHSGTVSPEKIGNWVLFVLNFVEVSRSLTAAALPAVAAPARPRRGRPAGRPSVRDRRLFKMLQAMYEYSQTGTGARSTVAYLSEVSGYAEASIPACISEIRSKWGVRIRKARWNGTYTTSVSHARLTEIEATINSPSVRPVRAARPAAFMPTVGSDDFALRGLNASVVSYFNERAAELGA